MSYTVRRAECARAGEERCGRYAGSTAVRGLRPGIGDGAPLRVAILSDTHGCLDARVAAEVRRCELAVHAGDVGGGEVLDAMQPTQGRIVAVRGNNDTPEKWRCEEDELLHRLPREATLELPGGVLVVVHGDEAGRPAGRHARLRARYPWARAVVYGHSHRFVCDRSGRPWVINPGAAGRARTYGGPSCIVLTATTSRWRLLVRRFQGPGPRARG